MAELEESIPSVLLPCNSCGRTFRPDALSKHEKYCEKSLIKKRKVFDSAKQRLQGTDLAEFLPVISQKKKCDKSPIRKTQSKWKEKHMEFVRAIRAAKGVPSSDSGTPAPPIKPVDHEKCLYCDRYFGPKAYDRHLEWCKEHHVTRVRPKSPASIQAKERLEARTKYKAPLLNKTRRASISEKCSPKNCTRDPSPAERLTRTRSSSLSSRTVSTITRETSSNVSPKNNIAMDTFKRNQPARNSRRSVSPMKKTTPDITKNKAANNNVNQNNRSSGRQVTPHESKSEAKKEPYTTSKTVKDDIFSASCNISTITPGKNQKQKIRTPAHNSGSKYPRIKATQNSPSKTEQCVLNTILVSQDVMGMTVQQCCLKSDTESDELAEKYYKVGEESKYLKCSKSQQSSLKKTSIRNESSDGGQLSKQDLIISNDIVHFTGHANQALVNKSLQVDKPSLMVSDNSDSDIQQSDSSIKSSNDIEDRQQNLGTGKLVSQRNFYFPVVRCSSIYHDSAYDCKLSTSNAETPIESVEVLSTDSKFLTAGLNINSFGDADSALEYSQSSDKLSGIESGENRLFTEENPTSFLNTETLCLCSSENDNADEVVLHNEVEVDVKLSVENEAKRSLELLFSKVTIDCKENVCFNCQKSKSDSDLQLFYRKDLLECCMNQKVRLFEVKKSLFSLQSNNTLDGSSIHSYCQECVTADEELENCEQRQVCECGCPDNCQSFTKYKSCTSIIDEKCSSANCSDKGSEIENISPIYNNEKLDKTTCEDNSDSPWESTHEILSPNRNLSSKSVHLIEGSKQTFCNDNCSNKVSGIEEISLRKDEVVEDTCGHINNSYDFPCESNHEILSPSRKVCCEGVDLIEGFVQVSISNTNQDYVGDGSFAVENDNLIGKSMDYFHKSVDDNVQCSSDHVDCENIDNSSLTVENPERSSTENDEHLNVITTDICRKENIGSINSRLETDVRSIENAEGNLFTSIIDTDKILEQNSNPKERHGEAPNVVMDASNGNTDIGCEEKQNRTIKRLNTRNKSRRESRETKIQNSERNPDSKKIVLDNVEIVDPCDSVGDKWIDKIQITSRKSMLQKKFKSRIPFKTDKTLAEVASLKSKVQTPSGNKNCVDFKTLKSRFPIIGKSSPMEIVSIPNIELPSLKQTESDSCAMLYFNTCTGQLCKNNNFNSDLKGFECANSNNKSFSLPPIKESSSFESSNSLNMKQSDIKIENVERNEVIKSIERKVFRKRRLPQIKKITNETNDKGVKEKKKIVKSMENYDPYKSAERQMKELLGLSDEDDALVHSLVPQPPPVLNSLNSAFAKFSPIQSRKNSNRSPDSDLDNDFERLEAESESRITPTLADRCGIVDKNFNPMSLSTISLCSTISIESFDNSRNNLRKGISSSAKVQSCDRKAQLPLQRSVSVVETPRRSRDFLKSNLKMEHLLFGVTGNNYNFNDNSLGCDVNDSSPDNKNLTSSNELLKNSNSSLASQAEQELLKSVSEFEKLFVTPSTINPYSPLIPNSSPANTLTPLDHIDKHRSHANKFITDSAYNSLNRKSPQQESPVDIDNCSSGSEGSSSTRGKAAQSANFCHECGAKFPVLAAKFCCNCGVRRLVI